VRFESIPAISGDAFLGECRFRALVALATAVPVLSATTSVGVSGAAGRSSRDRPPFSATSITSGLLVATGRSRV
jgi:hypothetical protein